MGMSADMLEDQYAHQIWGGEGFQPRNIKTVSCAEFLSQGQREDGISVTAATRSWIYF